MDGPELKAKITSIIRAESQAKEAIENQIQLNRRKRTNLTDIIASNHLELARLQLSSLYYPFLEPYNDQLRRLREGHTEEIERAKNEVTSKHTIVDSGNAVVAQTQTELNVAQAKFNRVEKSVTETLNTNTEYRVSVDFQKGAMRQLKLLSDKQEELKASVEQRHVKITSNPIIAYLIDVGYNTHQYSSIGITRRIESFLAAQSNYRQLKEEIVNNGNLALWWESRVKEAIKIESLASKKVQGLVYQVRKSYDWDSIEGELNEAKKRYTETLQIAKTNLSKLEVANHNHRSVTNFSSESSVDRTDEITSIFKSLRLADHNWNNDPNHSPHITAIERSQGLYATLKKENLSLEEQEKAAALRVARAERLKTKCRSLTASEYSYSTSRVNSEIQSYLDQEKTIEDVVRVLKRIQEEEVESYSSSPSYGVSIGDTDSSESGGGGFRTGGSF